MSYRYGRDWNVRLQKPIKEIDEAAARREFDRGPQVSVSKVADDQGPVPDYTLVLGVEGSHVRVQLYDGNGSVVEIYDWSAVEGEDRLFLDNYAVYVYADDASGPQTYSQSKAHKAWVFFQDGTARCRETVKGLPDSRVSTYQDLDLSGHWRERPACGDWDSFGREAGPRPAG